MLKLNNDRPPPDYVDVSKSPRPEDVSNQKKRSKSPPPKFDPNWPKFKHRKALLNERHDALAKKMPQKAGSRMRCCADGGVLLRMR